MPRTNEFGIETMAATAKFSWDRPLAIDVFKDIINRNRENRNRAANKALALAGQPKKKGRPPKTRLEEAQDFPRCLLATHRSLQSTALAPDHAHRREARAGLNPSLRWWCYREAQ